MTRHGRTIAEDARAWHAEAGRHLTLIADSLTSRTPWHPPRFGDPRLDPDALPNGREPYVNTDLTPHVPDRTAGPSDPTASAVQARGNFPAYVADRLLEQHDDLWGARVACYHDDAASVGDIPPPWHNGFPAAVDACVRSARRATADLLAEVERAWSRSLSIRPDDDATADAHVDLHVRPWSTALGDARATLHGLVHTAAMPCTLSRCHSRWEQARREQATPRCGDCGHRRIKYQGMQLCDACRRRQLRAS